MTATGTSVSVLKFVGTVSLGLLTDSIQSTLANTFVFGLVQSCCAILLCLVGVSYSITSLALPVLLRLPSSSSASHGLTSLNAVLKTPILALTSLASAPFLISFALAPRSSRHPYLLYTGLLATLSSVAPLLIPAPATRHVASSAPRQSSRAKMEASYEVLGDAHSEPASEEDIDINGEGVRVEVEGLVQSYIARTAFSALGFTMAVIGIWGDGAPQAIVYVS